MSDLFEQAKTRILDRIESPRDLLEFKLGAALKMERTVLGMLDTLHDEARRDELKQQFHHHSDETRMQIQNIERSFSLLGRDADEKPCPTIEALKKESKANIKLADERMVDAVLLSGAAETEHHEMAVYETLITLAEGQGHNDVAGLLSENLEQERHTLEEVRRAMQQTIPAGSHVG